MPWLLKFETQAKAAQIDPVLGSHADDILIEKPCPSSFHATGLDTLLRDRNIDTLIIAGCTTSVCVRATAIDAMQSVPIDSRKMVIQTYSAEDGTVNVIVKDAGQGAGCRRHRSYI